MGVMGGNRGRGMGINYMNTVSMHEILEKQLKIMKRKTLSPYHCFQMPRLLDSAHNVTPSSPRSPRPWRHSAHQPRPLHLTPSQQQRICGSKDFPRVDASPEWNGGSFPSPEWNGGSFHVFLCSHRIANHHSWDNTQEN